MDQGLACLTIKNFGVATSENLPGRSAIINPRFSSED